MGCHSVDILVYLFGAIHAATANIGAKSIKYGIDEYGEGMLQFKNGVVATFAGSWVDAGNSVTHQICGTEGHLVVMLGKVYYTSKRTKVQGADGVTPLAASNFPEPLPHAFDLFLDVLTGAQQKDVLIPVEDALGVARAMEAMYLGDRTGGWVKV
jgi:predicted dehydrogenase